MPMHSMARRLIIEDKSESTLLDCIHTIWIAVFGPMEELYFDGEGGLGTQSAKDHLKRLGVTIKIRAPEQHAQYAERHGALLRLVMHLTEEQCKREGLRITARCLLAQSLFVCNAMQSTGNATPYNAVLGRQPAILPPLADPTAVDGAGDSTDGRREARIREIAVSSMTQASAMARINRATKAKTSSDTRNLYKPGDMVDYRRKNISDGKDVSPWRGPVPVTKVTPADGNLTLKLANGREHPYRFQDVRHTLLVMHTFFTGGLSSAFGACKYVQDYVESLATEVTETYGLAASRSGECQPTKHTLDNHQVAAALAHAVRNNLMIAKLYRSQSCTWSMPIWKLHRCKPLVATVVVSRKP